MTSLKLVPGYGGSIRRTLPLWACAVLLATATATVALAYTAVRQVLLEAGQARVGSVSRQLASLLESSAHGRVTETYALTRNAGVRAALENATDASIALARRELDDHLTRNSQVLGVQLWTRSGESRVTITRSDESDQNKANRLVVPTASGVSAFGAVGSVVYYDIVVPVIARDDGTRSPHGADPQTVDGYLLVRRVATSPTAAKTIRQLAGEGILFQVGTRARGVWTNLEHVTPAPAFAEADGADGDRITTSGAAIAATTPVRGTPWTLAVSMPQAAALAPAHDFLKRIIPFGIAVCGAAGILVWLMVGSITRPLNALTEAAEAIASRNYRHIDLPSRTDEIGRLTDAFNTMSDRIHHSHTQLEDRVRERTRELEAAMAALRAAQEQLVRRERLAILGQLAGGVGHELRNPLGVMTNAVYYLELIQDDVTDDVREYHGILRAQIGLAEKIIGDLLDFARVRPPQRSEIPLVAIVEEQLRRLVCPANIRVELDFAPDLALPHVDPVQVGQVVFNLILNAIQVMDIEGGVLTLRGAADGSSAVMLMVEDTGPGIPFELRGQIFEPLFTTKARGIGLGLAVSRGLAEANGGTLILSHESTGGATFVLTLPVRTAVEEAA